MTISKYDTNTVTTFCLYFSLQTGASPLAAGLLSSFVPPASCTGKMVKTVDSEEEPEYPDSFPVRGVGLPRPPPGSSDAALVANSESEYPLFMAPPVEASLQRDNPDEVELRGFAAPSIRGGKIGCSRSYLTIPTYTYIEGCLIKSHQTRAIDKKTNEGRFFTTDLGRKTTTALSRGEFVRLKGHSTLVKS